MIPIASIDDLIYFHEGRRHQCYDDATSLPLNLGDHCKGTATIGEGHTGPEVQPGLVWTDEQIAAAKAADLAIATSRAAADIGVEWDGIDEVRQAAFIDMAFEMGGNGLAGFHHMIIAARAGDWSAASRFALESAWARTEAPHRARDDADMILTGQWPITG